MEALGINLGFFIVQLFNFVIVLIVLTTWAYRPVVGLLEQRRRRIAQGLEDARVASEARANAEAEAQKILATAQTEANQRVSEATERAQKAAADVRAAAEQERARILNAAQEDAAHERNRILADLRGQVAALAISAAQKVVGESLDERRQHTLIEEFFSGVMGGKFTMLEGEAVAGNAAEVTSALPLSAEEQETVRRDIVAKLGGSPAVVFRVDPGILGGVMVRVGDKVVDASVAGRLEGLRANLR
ncbi:MAG: F0F1 ATP synthase subunit B [Anaerolineales bacterium]|nr:F0F1 ATP synthase subunit B [Anaerolineales bacterium]